MLFLPYSDGLLQRMKLVWKDLYSMPFSSSGSFRIFGQLPGCCTMIIKKPALKCFHPVPVVQNTVLSKLLSIQSAWCQWDFFPIFWFHGMDFHRIDHCVWHRFSIQAYRLYVSCEMKAAQKLMFGSFIYLPVVQIIWMIDKLFQ